MRRVHAHAMLALTMRCTQPSNSQPMPSAIQRSTAASSPHAAIQCPSAALRRTQPFNTHPPHSAIQRQSAAHSHPILNRRSSPSNAPPLLIAILLSSTKHTAHPIPHCRTLMRCAPCLTRAFSIAALPRIGVHAIGHCRAAACILPKCTQPRSACAAGLCKVMSVLSNCERSHAPIRIRYRPQDRRRISWSRPLCAPHRRRRCPHRRPRARS